jgi:PAS domain S-box-containing protein
MKQRVQPKSQETRSRTGFPTLPPLRFADEEVLALLHGIPHGVALLDSTLRLLCMNRRLESLTGHAGEEVVGIAAPFVLRSNLDNKELFASSALQNRETVSREGDIIDRDRRRLPVRITVSPLTMAAGGAEGFLLVVEDISLLTELGSKRQGFAGAEDILGHSPRMQEILQLLPLLAQTDATLLITGETGTGKDLFAETVHKASSRAKYPFIKVNCGALPESLLESELFGHVRGAFTGAHSDKPGLFRLAQGGTIFLTEIGDLPLPLQVKLLTVLDDREFFPVGSSKKVRVDVRLITGTHRDLKELVGQGRFREDLYFRLNVLRAHLPPLREREGDVRLLADHFLRSFTAALHKNISGFGSRAFARLLAYNFPGNVRELRNIVEYAANICPQGSIGPEHLPEYIQESSGEAKVRPAPAAPAPIVPEKGGQAANWTEIEKKQILAALLATGGNRGKAARQLGWARSTLWRKMHQHGLN